MQDELDWDGFDPQWRWVFPVVGGPQIGLSLCIQAWIRGPHTRARLGNVPNLVFHCASADGPATGGKLACALSMGKDLEEGDRGFDVME